MTDSTQYLRWRWGWKSLKTTLQIGQAQWACRCDKIHARQTKNNNIAYATTTTTTTSEFCLDVSIKDSKVSVIFNKAISLH